MLPAIGKIILIIAAALGLYLVGNGSVSLWDRDEPRYAQTSRQMLQSGDWVVPMLLDQPREKKPVFIYWCQAAAMTMFGGNAFAARFPSAIFVTATLVVLATVLWKSAGPRRALWTTFIFGTSGLTIAAAKMSITDGVLVLFITVAQICLYAILNGRSTWPVVVTCGIAVGFGLLTKGPVVPLVMLMTLLVWKVIQWRDRADRRVRFSGPVTSVRTANNRSAEADPTKITITVLKWIVAIALAVAVYWGLWGHRIEQRLPNYHIRTIKAEVIDRTTAPQEGHRGPPGYYLLTVWGTLFPWSLLLPSAILSAWQNRRLPQIRFALAAIIGPWIMFEIVRTKLPHYVLPTYPAIAFLIADMFIRIGRQARLWRLYTQKAATAGHPELLAKGLSGSGRVGTAHQFATEVGSAHPTSDSSRRTTQNDTTAAPQPPLGDRLFLTAVLVWAGAVIVISLFPWLALHFFGAPPAAGWIAMVLLPILALEYSRSVYIHFRNARPLDAAAIMGIGMLILIGVLYGLYLPNAGYLQISKRIGQELREEHATYPGAAVMIDYKEMSLPFYQGGTIRPQDNHFLETTDPIEWPKWVVITQQAWDQTPPSIKMKFEKVGAEVKPISGVNYADRLRRIDVLVVRRRESAIP